MIRNQAQYELTRQWAERFERDAAALEVAPLAPGVSPDMRPILVAAARSEARILREQLAEYDNRTEAHDRER